MATNDIQLALHAHLSQANQANDPQILAKHLEAFSSEWRKEPSLEHFDTALGLLRDSRKSANYETWALWWMGYLQEICLNTHIDKYSIELSNGLLKCADPLAELIKGSSAVATKRALQVCSTIYPTVYQICCQDSAAHVNLWNEYAIRIKQLALSHFGGASEGIILSLCKYIQTVVQVQSHSQPNSTPQESESLSLNRIPPNHPFLNTNILQHESDRLLRDLLSVIQMPAVMQLQPPQSQALTEALSAYGIKFSGSALSRLQQQQLLHPDKDNGDDSRRYSKRSRPSNHDNEDVDMKRLKPEPDVTPVSVTPPAPIPAPIQAPPNIPPGFGQTLLGQINITQLPLHHVVDIIFETLAANGVPHLFHSFLSTLPVMRLKEGPLPIPPPGVGPPPPGLLLQRPPPLLPGMVPTHPGGIFPPPPHMPPPSHQGPAAAPQLPAPTVLPGVKQEAKQEVKKEANISKLQLPKIPDDVQVNIAVLPPKHTPTQLPTRPTFIKSDSVTIAPRMETLTESEVKVEPKVEIEEAQRLLKEETFQVKPFEPTSERPGVNAAASFSRKLLEQTFERILDSEYLVSVPGASGRKMLEAAASSYQQSGRAPEEHQSVVVPFGGDRSTGQPTKVVTKADWMTIVARLLTRAFARDSEASAASTNAGSLDQDMKEKMIKYICEDFKQRRELALTWLHEEWYYDGICQRQAEGMDDREPQYLWCLYKILDGITSGATQLDAKDRGLTRFLLEVPELPDGAVDIIQKYCDDPLRAQLGMACLRDVVNLRPPSRPRALEILLSYTAHTDKLQRSMAIVTAKKWYLEHPTVGVKVEEYALTQLESLKDYNVPKREASVPRSTPVPSSSKVEGEEVTAVQTLATGNVDPSIKTEMTDRPMNSEHGKESSADPQGATSLLVSASAMAQAEEDIGRLLELYLSLCAKNHSLLEVLFTHYISYDPFVQRVIRQKIQPLIKSIKSDSPKLLALIRDFPIGAEMLALRIIFILTDGVQPSPGLVSAVQDAVIRHDLNARFLIPIIGGMDREAVFLSLPRIVGLLKGTERERRTVTDVFIKVLTGSGSVSGQSSGPSPTAFDIRPNSTSGVVSSTSIQSQQQGSISSTQARGPIMSPSELLIELHALEDTVGWKAACEAMDICFNHPEIYKSEIIAVVLQQLLDQPAIPSLFMRTVIQAITLYKNLVGFVNSMILAKLINRKVWTRPVLWKGFVRCAKIMQPTSSSVLASLPKPQLKEVLAMEPSLKEPVEAYIKAKSSGRRIGGGAAKQVNVLNVTNNNITPSIPGPLATEDGIKKEQDLGIDSVVALRATVDDVVMGSYNEQGPPTDVKS
ncbi:hypothetical protein BGZ79_005800 [Entomortierella chlamydospora]|nr:hypothetical protein BGZ79_005800 [Entomortierella chlamydospora]